MSKRATENLSPTIKQHQTILHTPQLKIQSPPTHMHKIRYFFSVSLNSSSIIKSDTCKSVVEETKILPFKSWIIRDKVTCHPVQLKTITG